jgi:diguanylate cyclase (GGDEF)-like protein
MQKIIDKYPDNMHVLIVLDIHNFSYFNIEYGTEIGDKLLIKISKDINKIFNKFKEKIIAKNDDDFLIFIQNIKNNDLIEIIENIKTFFNKTYNINNLHLVINSHVGITIYPKDEKNSKKLLEFAYIALKKSKDEGINTYKFYNEKLLDQIRHQKNAITIIEEAVKHNKFVLFYQPRIDTLSKKIVGAESLLRIKKDNKIIPSFEFIEELEKSHYIQQIDLNLLDKIDEIITKTNLDISFNLSSKSFKDEKIINKMIKIANKHPQKLEIELIERSLIEDTEYSAKILSKLKKHNVLIAIDDFGTGYSSLSYLVQFPIDIIKIDLSFIQTMLTNRAFFEIVKATINLSKELNIKTVAEGVETKEQFLTLKVLGCNYIQGYYFYKPMSEENFLKLIQNQ